MLGLLAIRKKLDLNPVSKRGMYAWHSCFRLPFLFRSCRTRFMLAYHS